MKKIFILIPGIFFLSSGLALAQNTIDFENMTIDVLADSAYQAATPFFPGVHIQTIDNATGIPTDWPVVVRAYENVDCTSVIIPDYLGTIPAFNSDVCGSNSTNNYPVGSNYNSLLDSSELIIDPLLGLIRQATTPRKHDGYLISFNYPIKDFSLSIADWGDYFPTGSGENKWPSYIELIAYDESNTIVDYTKSTELRGADRTNRDATGLYGIITLGVTGSNIRNVEVRFRGYIDPGVSIDDITFTSLNVDIKPGSYPNCFNSNEHGVIPVAILGSANFDVTMINPSTVQLDGQEVRVKGKSGNWGSLEDVNGDGFTDLVVQIIDEGEYEVGDSIGIITAETWSGELIGGQDSICITR